MGYPGQLRKESRSTGLVKKITHVGNLHKMYPVVRKHLIFSTRLQNIVRNVLQFILADRVKPKFLNAMLSKTPVFNSAVRSG